MPKKVEYPKYPEERTIRVWVDENGVEHEVSDEGWRERNLPESESEEEESPPTYLPQSILA